MKKQRSPSSAEKAIGNPEILFQLLKLQSPSQVCDWERLKRSSVSLEKIWKYLIQRDFQIAAEIGGFSSFKSQYACLYNMLRNSFTFNNFDRMGCIPKGRYKDFKQSFIGRLTLKPPPVSKLPMPRPTRNKKYLSAICSDPALQFRFCLHENTIWFTARNSGFQKILGQRLNTDSPLIQSMTQRRPIKILKSNGKGLLISVDTNDLLTVWSIRGTHLLKTRGDIPIDGGIASIDISDIKIAIVSNEGSVSVWDVNSGHLMSVFSLPNDQLMFFKGASDKKIVISDSLLGIALSNGFHFMYARDKYGLYHFQEVIPNTIVDDDAHVHCPNTFIIKSNIVVTNSTSENDSLTFWHLQKMKNPLPCLYGNGQSKPLLNSVQAIQKLYTIQRLADVSESDVLKRIGIHAFDDPGDLAMACFDPDMSMLLAIMEDENQEKSNRLLVFDYRINRTADRFFQRVMLDDLHLWLCFECV